MHMIALRLAAGVSLAMTFGSLAHAQTVAPGFDTVQLPANDDGSAGPVLPGFALNYFGTTYTSLYVNNNGNVTFNNSQSQFTPTGLGASYQGQPIIAPFFADVDTRGAGSGLTSYGVGTYNGEQAFGVTWPAVGYYGEHTDKLNTFQLILADRSDTGVGNFDIYFNYNQIQWETGDASGGRDGLGGVSAAAGFSNGTGDPGTFFQIAGSLVNGALIDGGPNALVSNTNDGVAGQFLFEVRNGQVVPPAGAPAPLAGAGLLSFFGAGGVAVRKRAKRLLGDLFARQRSIA